MTTSKQKLATFINLVETNPDYKRVINEFLKTRESNLTSIDNIYQSVQTLSASSEQAKEKYTPDDINKDGQNVYQLLDDQPYLQTLRAITNTLLEFLLGNPQLSKTMNLQKSFAFHPQLQHALFEACGFNIITNETDHEQLHEKRGFGDTIESGNVNGFIFGLILKQPYETDLDKQISYFLSALDHKAKQKGSTDSLADLLNKTNQFGENIIFRTVTLFLQKSYEKDTRSNPYGTIPDKFISNAETFLKTLKEYGFAPNEKSLEKAKDHLRSVDLKLGQSNQKALSEKLTNIFTRSK